jgi:CcmD family protein
MTIRRLLKRLRAACVAGMMVAGLAAPPVVAAQPRTPAAQDEFVPLKDLPPDETLPAAPLVIGAYAFIWFAVMVYVWLLWRRMTAVDRELALLRRDIENRARR